MLDLRELVGFEVALVAVDVDDDPSRSLCDNLPSVSAVSVARFDDAYSIAYRQECTTLARPRPSFAHATKELSTTSLRSRRLGSHHVGALPLGGFSSAAFFVTLLRGTLVSPPPNSSGTRIRMPSLSSPTYSPKYSEWPDTTLTGSPCRKVFPYLSRAMALFPWKGILPRGLQGEQRADSATEIPSTLHERTTKAGEEMTPTEISALIENWTQEERGSISGALMSLRVGAVKLDDTTNTWCMPMAQNIPAKSTQAVSARGYVGMKPSKLVILEPAMEIIEREEIVTEAKMQRAWWGTRCLEPLTSRTIEHKRVVHVPRAIWRVRSMFIGAQAQLPTEKDIAGDLFGPEGTLTLPDAIIPGLDVTICIENTTSQAMPFSMRSY